MGQRMNGKSITCPVCLKTSWNPNDVWEGYCGACHDYTSDMRASLRAWYKNKNAHLDEKEA